MELQALTRVPYHRLLTLKESSPGMSDDRTAELEAAVRAQDALIAEAQRLMTSYLAKEIELPALADGILNLFDGPRQREVQQLAREAQGEDFGNNA
jgi:hypothetical protein